MPDNSRRRRTHRKFDTERFILEVQARVYVWDSEPNRTAKKRAWEEIAKLLHDNWDDEIETKQRELVDELQKKWKHFTDYYVKEKKLENIRSESAAPKKHKNSYVELLRFLDVVKDSRISSGNISSPVGDNDHTKNSCDELSTNTNSQQTVIEDSCPPQTQEVPETSQIKNKSKLTVFQQSLITTMNRKQQPPKEEKDRHLQISCRHTKFFISLLPQIKSRMKDKIVSSE